MPGNRTPHKALHARLKEMRNKRLRLHVMDRHCKTWTKHDNSTGLTKMPIANGDYLCAKIVNKVLMSGTNDGEDDEDAGDQEGHQSEIIVYFNN